MASFGMLRHVVLVRTDVLEEWEFQGNTGELVTLVIVLWRELLLPSFSFEMEVACVSMPELVDRFLLKCHVRSLYKMLQD
jgi:hypothetical protein